MWLYEKIPDEIIKSYFGNIINIHPSLLPRYKGLNTHEKVILNNDTVHGCTTHYVTTNIDDILLLLNLLFLFAKKIT